MDYKQLIIDGANSGNWDEIINLAKQAKYATEPETIFGIKRGYVNIFKGYGSYVLKEQLESIGAKVFQFGLSGLTYAVKDGSLAKELENNYVILLTHDTSVVDRLATHNFMVNIYSYTTDSVGVEGTDYRETQSYYGIDKESGRRVRKERMVTKWRESYPVCVLKDRQNGATHKFKKTAITGLYRETRIDKIFED